MLNEAEVLPELLTHLEQFKVDNCEVIFVDGGSSDGSDNLVKALGYPLIGSSPGRAKQMNAGAAQAVGDMLIFLHADTRLPSNALTQINQACAKGVFKWGRFDVTITGHSFWLKWVAVMMNWRSRVTQIATGDQAMFVRRELFIKLGGFPVQPIMEDIALSKKLKRQHKPACVKERVITSGRRWERRGVWRTILLMWLLRLLFSCGVSPRFLAAMYR